MLNAVGGSRAHNSLSEQFVSEIQDQKRVEVARDFYIGYCLINRDLLDETPPIIAPGAFMSDLSTPDRAYEALQLSTLGRPVLLIDMPGHGLSSPHTKQQTYDLCIRRSASSSAEPMLEAVKSIVGESQKIDYFGISHGGHLALKMAELEATDRISTVFGLDISGTKKCFTLQTQVGYLLLDGIKGRKQYRNMIKDSEAEQDYAQFKDFYSGLETLPLPKFFLNNPGLAFLNTFASINARPSALSAWEKLLKEKTARVSVYTAANSHVSDATAIQSFIDKLPI